MVFLAVITLRRVSFYLHPFLNRLRTCSNKPLPAFNLNNTHPAGSGRSKFLHPAKRGYNNTIAVKSRKDRFSFFGFDLLVIYLDRE